MIFGMDVQHLRHMSLVNFDLQCESKIPIRFTDIFPKRLGIFSPNFTHLIYVSIYAGLQICIQLSAILTKLWHIMTYYARPPSSHYMFKLSTIGRNIRWHFLTFFPNSWEFLVQISHTYYTFLSTLDYKILFNYLQLWRSYAISSATNRCAFQPMVDILST